MLRKKSVLIWLAVIIAVAVFAFAACGGNGGDGGDTGNPSDIPDSGKILDDAADSVDLTDTERELNTEWEGENAVAISFSSSGVSVAGLGAAYYSVSGSVVTINANEAKTYVLSGTSANGRVVFDKKNEDRIVLNGLNLTSATSAPLSMMKKADRVLTIADGTTNTLTDAAVYTDFDDDERTEPNAALFAKNSLTINGGGTLTVNGKNNNGIGSKETLKILGGNITVNAPNNALKGNDAVLIKGGTLTLTGDEDGIKSDSVDEATGEALGYVYIENASVNITSKQDGVQADNILYIKSGSVTVKTNGGAAANTSSSGSNQGNRPGGGWNEPTGGDGVSRKGLKAGNNIVIEGGTFNLDCYDDGVHCNDTVFIGSGTMSVKSGDDGFHADKIIKIDDSDITVSASYEGLEAAKVTINGGRINLTATDDGINASDGTTARVGAGNSNCVLTINGGEVTVNAGGDGIDSNGSLVINGGNVTVHGSSTSANEGLDSDGSMYINGGVVAASGPSSLMDKPSTGSAQNILIIYFTSAQSAGTVISVKNAGGETVLSYTGVKTFNSLIVSGENIKTNETYGIYQGGTLYKSATVSSRITNVGSSSGGGRW